MEPHIAILPSPGMGHLIPLTEFAKLLHHHHGVAATLIIPTDSNLSDTQNSFLSTLPPAIDYLLLPPVNLDDLPPDVKIETRISLTVTRSLPSIRDAVKSLCTSNNISALVVDLFGTDAFDIAREFNLPAYLFFCSTAMVLSVVLHLPVLDETVSCEYRDLPEKLRIPGCIPIHGRDLMDPVQDRKNEAYEWILHQAKRYKMADGILVNTFKELEPGPVQYLLKKETGKPAVYPIGPLIKKGSKCFDDVCSKWLDDQPIGSVLFVSFGSGGTLSHDQIIELAFGLELSEQRFLWVLRCPNATFFKIENSDDPLAYLPQGFLERTKGRGLVVPLWGPQTQILSHESVGAFLTHCGWNSVLESVVNGVPMICWPLYAEQRMNAAMLHEHVRVALRPQVGPNGMVGRVDVVNVVKGLMEGEEGKGIRIRMRDLNDAANKALSQNGSSKKFMAEFVAKWNASTSI